MFDRNLYTPRAKPAMQESVTAPTTVGIVIRNEAEKCKAENANDNNGGGGGGDGPQGPGLLEVLLELFRKIFGL